MERSAAALKALFWAWSRVVSTELGVSRAALAKREGVVAVNDLRNEPRCDRCWRRDPTTAPCPDGGLLCDRCAKRG